jgi:hypothetical protein
LNKYLGFKIILTIFDVRSSMAEVPIESRFPSTRKIVNNFRDMGACIETPMGASYLHKIFPPSLKYEFENLLHKDNLKMVCDHAVATITAVRFAENSHNVVVDSTLASAVRPKRQRRAPPGAPSIVAASLLVDEAGM